MTKVYSAGKRHGGDNVVIADNSTKEAKDFQGKVAKDVSYERKAFKYNTTVPSFRSWVQRGRRGIHWWRIHPH